MIRFDGKWAFGASRYILCWTTDCVVITTDNTKPVSVELTGLLAFLSLASEADGDAAVNIENVAVDEGRCSRR